MSEEGSPNKIKATCYICGKGPYANVKRHIDEVHEKIKRVVRDPEEEERRGRSTAKK